jgi:threonine dehydrogenase-like Zn-dependent dehydrogenase
MKAMLLTAPGELVRDDVTQPGPEQGQLLVRVTHSGICGTDFKIFNGAIPVKYPRIMGHEMAGEVVETGASQLHAGDRVIVDPQLYCRTCFHCRIGQTHLCRNGVLVGRDRDGGFAEYVTVPASHVFPLPASVETRVAPLIQVLTTCLHAQRQIDIFPGEFVALGSPGNCTCSSPTHEAQRSSASRAAPTNARWQKRSERTSRYRAATMPWRACER